MFELKSQTVVGFFGSGIGRPIETWTISFTIYLSKGSL